MKIHSSENADDGSGNDTGTRSILADAPFARVAARRRRPLARGGDVSDTREFERLVRDIVEAYHVEEDLRARLPLAARDLDRDAEKRDVLVRMVRDAGVPLSDRDVGQLLRRAWTTDHVARYGRAPSPSTVRRWCQIRCHDVGLRSTSVAKALAERASLGTAGSSPRSSASRRRGSHAVAPAGREAAASVDPAIGDVVHVDGIARRYLGRTMSGRSAYADLHAQAGRRPVVRIDRSDEGARIDVRS